MIARRVRWVAVVVGVAIAVASLTRPPDGVLGARGPLGLVARDKWFHTLAYGTLATTLMWALSGCDRRTAALAIAGAVTYGIGIELVQGVLPYRSLGLADAGVNAVGAVLGVGTARLLGVGVR